MSTIYTIYKATNTINGKSYIGFDSNWPARKRSHLKNSRKGCTKFHNAISKYGIDAFIWEIIYQSKNQKHTLNIMEHHFIQQYNTIINGYNICVGGSAPNLGRKASQETKDKMSKSRKGRASWSKGKTGIFSTETLKKLSEASMGNKHSLGFKHSQETKDLWSKQRTGSKNGMYGKPGANLNKKFSSTTKQRMSIAAKKYLAENPRSYSHLAKTYTVHNDGLNIHKEIKNLKLYSKTIGIKYSTLYSALTHKTKDGWWITAHC